MSGNPAKLKSLPLSEPLIVSIGTMPPNGWTTPDEREFLRPFLLEYETYQFKRQYMPFWKRLNADYFAKFPMVERLYPGLKFSELDQDQKSALSEATMRQQKRLKEWFRWRKNPRSRNAGCSISRKDLQVIYNPRTRASKPYEMFARLYPALIASEKKDRCEGQGVVGRAMLGIWHQVAKELFEKATPEQLEAVKKEMNGADLESDCATESSKAYARFVL